MIFSFDDYEHTDLQIWVALEKILPEGYDAPDRAFLQSLDPTMLGESFIESGDMLNPYGWDGDASFWLSVVQRLPEHYFMPDTTLIKRLLEID
jgi:hypothetical protein